MRAKRLTLWLVPTLAAVLGVVGFAIASSEGATSTCQGAPPQVAVCEGQTAAVTPPTLPATTESPWALYGGVDTLTNNPIDFVNDQVGLMVEGIGVGPSLDHFVAAGNAGEIFPGNSIATTSNGGASWSVTLTSPTGFWGLDALDAQHIWVVGVNSLFESSDAGQTWTELQQDESSSNAPVSVDFASASTGIALTANGVVLVTIDGGTSWATPTVAQPMTSAQTSCTMGNSVLVAAAGGIWSTPSNSPGSSWTQVATESSSTSELATMDCDASTSWATWQPQSIGPASDGPSGAIEVASENGTTWSSPSSVPTTEAPRFSWVPVTGASQPTAVGGNDDEVLQISASSGLQPATGTGLLFSGPNATSDVDVIHGVYVLPDGTGWLLADQFDPGSAGGSASIVGLVEGTTNGGSTWTQLYTYAD